MLVGVDAVANHAFDYVIIGGGTAGLVLAARLTEDPTISVCLLEAGPASFDDLTFLRTGVYATHVGNPTFDWVHLTTKQNIIDRPMLFSRGRGLGGSSIQNFMVWQRPPADEIDDFERLGNPGWNWANLHKYMKKCETFVPPSTDVLDIPYKNWDLGRDGPLLVSFPRTISELEEYLYKALLESGIPESEKPYDGKLHGAHHSMNSSDPYTYSRSYSTSAYYHPNKARPNLTVLANALVDRIYTKTSASGDLVAKEVVFIHQNNTYSVKVTKEALLCAGAVQSPVVLERSGIGRSDILGKAEVPVKLDLPGVGENLQEHSFLSIGYELKDDVPYPTFDIARDPALLPAQLELYKEGAGTLCMGIMTFAYVSLEDVTPNAEAIYQKAKAAIGSLDANVILPSLLDQYEIQLDRLRPGQGRTGPGCEFIMNSGIIASPTPTPSGKKYITVSPALNHALSRGWLHIVSKDPIAEPEIDPCYFDIPTDLDIFVEMVKRARQIGQAPCLQAFIANESFPGLDVQTDEEIADFVKKAFATTWHTAGTCSMLPREKGGVVDNHLKVYGTENVRVIDLSIVPLHFACHPQCVVYGIAEMAADIIKGKLQI